MIQEKTYKVELSDVDFKQELKFSALANKLQDLAHIASHTLGIGFETIYEKYGVVWALVRMRVDLKRNPKLGESLYIQTWAPKPKSLQFERDFMVRDESGEIIIRVVTAWVIIDYQTRRIKKATTILPEAYEDPGIERAINGALGKIKANGELIPKYQKVIGYSDIDLNGHLNNSKYVDFIMDCFSLEEHQNYRISSLEVSFVNEALAGETITMFEDRSRLSEGIIYIEGIKQENDSVSFRAQLQLES